MLFEIHSLNSSASIAAPRTRDNSIQSKIPDATGQPEENFEARKALDISTSTQSPPKFLIFPIRQLSPTIDINDPVTGTRTNHRQKRNLHVKF
jgi:hypothetical protein